MLAVLNKTPSFSSFLKKVSQPVPPTSLFTYQYNNAEGCFVSVVQGG